MLQPYQQQFLHNNLNAFIFTTSDLVSQNELPDQSKNHFEVAFHNMVAVDAHLKLKEVRQDV